MGEKEGNRVGEREEEKEDKKKRQQVWSKARLTQNVRERGESNMAIQNEAERTQTDVNRASTEKEEGDSDRN